jgi:hypothetical protein
VCSAGVFSTADFAFHSTFQRFLLICFLLQNLHHLRNLQLSNHQSESSEAACSLSENTIRGVNAAGPVLQDSQGFLAEATPESQQHSAVDSKELSYREIGATVDSSFMQNTTETAVLSAGMSAVHEPDATARKTSSPVNTETARSLHPRLSMQLPVSSQHSSAIGAETSSPSNSPNCFKILRLSFHKYGQLCTLCASVFLILLPPTQT